MKVQYDVIIIGGGPAGYIAAIRCAQLGLRTVCIEQAKGPDGKLVLGGTCLNIGCIPSKALLDSSEQYHKLQHQLSDHGISVDSVDIDIPRMQQRKQEIVNGLTKGVAQLFKAHKISHIHGRARLMANKNVTIFDINSGEVIDTLVAADIILAPGSIPVELPQATFDHEAIMDSTGALAFEQVPDRLGIIGAGAIGLELGSVWNRLGSTVTILEALDQFLPAVDHQVSREAMRQFKKQGLHIRLAANVGEAKTTANGVNIHYVQKEKDRQIEVDKVVVAVGRKPATDGLIAPDCGVETDERGFIRVDDQCRTTETGIWAIGDAVRGPMLAHKGSEEGVAVAESIAGGNGHVDFGTIPWVIYTSPEIAWVGMTENQAREQGIDYRTGAFPFAANGRARAMAETSGFVKIIADADSDQLLGVHMIGAHASELIAECGLAMSYQASAEDLARTIHAHPTLSEAVHEAALAVDKRALHKA